MQVCDEERQGPGEPGEPLPQRTHRHKQGETDREELETQRGGNRREHKGSVWRHAHGDK